MSYTQSVTLKDGTTVTLRAWTLEEIGANSRDFLEMLNIHSAGLAPTEAGAMAPEAAPSALQRLITRSLVNPDDAERIRATDLGAVQQAIWEVNGLGEFVGKSLALRLEARKQQLAALETLNEPATQPMKSPQNLA